MLPEHDLDELFASYARAYEALPMPALVCDGQLKVRHANREARTRFSAIAAGGKLDFLLGEYRPEQLMERIGREGGCTVKGVLPLSGTTVSLTPIFAGTRAAGAVLLMVPGEDRVRNASLDLAARTVNALQGSLRDSVGSIFAEMDTLALKADFLRSGWVRAGFNRIGAEAYRILRVSSNIAEYTRIQNGAAVSHEALLDLAGEFYAARDVIVEIGKDAGIPVDCRVPEEACFVRGDGERLGLAFYNILHNSFRYTRPGNQVTFRLEKRDSFAALTIQDQGAGIPEELMPEIWRPYVSGTHPGLAHGLGLGLTIARAVIEAHGGDIRLESQENQGTCVTIRLPITGALSGALNLAQESDTLRSSDRFSSLYVGLADLAGDCEFRPS